MFLYFNNLWGFWRWRQLCTVVQTENCGNLPPPWSFSIFEVTLVRSWWRCCLLIRWQGRWLSQGGGWCPVGSMSLKHKFPNTPMCYNYSLAAGAWGKRVVDTRLLQGPVTLNELEISLPVRLTGMLQPFQPNSSMHVVRFDFCLHTDFARLTGNLS